MTQDTAISILKTGVNVFLTGEPGSGKTHTVNRYISYLRQHGVQPAITASTGIAATHLGGMTIHSWSGIGIKKELTKTDLAKLRGKKRLVSRAAKTNVLVIDEVSMLDSRTLFSVDSAVKTLLQNSKPFGGLQVVFVGDFFQLPPVWRSGEPKVGFAFESESWREADPVICYLSEQHRQSDTDFLSLLGSIRSGDEISEIHSKLSDRTDELKQNEGFTHLYSHNVDVDRINNERLEATPGEEHTFQMESRGQKALVEQLKKGCLSPETLVLKKQARVMFTKNNFEKGFVNGTLGEVVGFDTEGPIVKTKAGREIKVLPMDWEMNDGDKTMAVIIQMPLRLAWAITIHKSQGMTLDAAIVDLRHAFEYGQGYVALSRVRALSGLALLGYNRRALEVHPGILEKDSDFKQKSMEVEKEYVSLAEKELYDKHKEFILACGGKLEKVKPKKKREPGVSTHDITLKLIRDGSSIEKMVEERGLKTGTIINHVVQLFMRGKVSPEEVRALISPSTSKALPQIEAVFEKVGTEHLGPVFGRLKGKHSFDELRLVRLLVQ